MSATTLLLNDLQAGWKAFDRLDAGDESHITGFTLIEHEPSLFCLAQYDFDTGVGVELTWTDLVGDDEEDELLRRLWPARPIVRQRYGVSEAGFAQTRVRAWHGR